MSRLNQYSGAASVQIFNLGDIPEGNFSIKGKYFLIKNITGDSIEVNIRMPLKKEFITTILYPGWNVEVVEEIKDVQSNTLQYGY